MQEHRLEALGKPVFEDLEPGCFAQVQSELLFLSKKKQIWSLAVLHRYKAINLQVSLHPVDLEPGCFAQVQSINTFLLVQSHI